MRVSDKCCMSMLVVVVVTTIVVMTVSGGLLRKWLCRCADSRIGFELLDASGVE